MSFKKIFLKQMLKSKLKDIPETEQEKILTLIENNPELFQKIAVEIQEEIKNGKDQMTATMEVMRKHEEELRKIAN